MPDAGPGSMSCPCHRRPIHGPVPSTCIGIVCVSRIRPRPSMRCKAHGPARMRLLRFTNTGGALPSAWPTAQPLSTALVVRASLGTDGPASSQQPDSFAREQVALALQRHPELLAKLRGSADDVASINQEAHPELEWTELSDGRINYVYLLRGPHSAALVKHAASYVKSVGPSFPLSQVCCVQAGCMPTWYLWLQHAAVAARCGGYLPCSADA